jgi:ribosomal protein S27E
LKRYKRNELAKETQNQQVVCSICGEVLLKSLSSKHLIMHKLKEKMAEEKIKKAQEQKVECPVCHKILLKTSLVKHLNLHELKRGRKKYECCICSSRFYTLEDLKKHTQIHAKTLMCPSCGRKFAFKWQLRNHLNKH